MSDYNSEDYNKRSREACPISDSELCNWLDRGAGCYHCYIATLKNEEDKKKAMERWMETLSYVPENIDDLHTSDDCQFCKEQPPQKIDGYATIDMAHPEPYSAKGMFFGIGKKVRTPVGSLLTLQIGVCKECKKAFRLLDYWHLGVFFTFLVASFLLLMIPGFANPMVNLFPLMPVIFVVLMAAAGFFLGKMLGMNALKRAAKTVKIDLTEIPLIRQMLTNGWFFFQANNGVPRLYFRKEKLYKRLRKECPAEQEDDIPLDNINI